MNFKMVRWLLLILCFAGFGGSAYFILTRSGGMDSGLAWAVSTLFGLLMMEHADANSALEEIKNELKEIRKAKRRINGSEESGGREDDDFAD